MRLLGSHHRLMARTGTAVPTRRSWHATDLDEVAALLDTDLEHGLSTEEAARRLEIHGPNRISRPARWTRLKRVASQFDDVLIWLLLVAAAISGVFLGSWVDAGAIATIIALNAAIGYAQESRANSALESLRELEAPTATVVRDRVVMTIDARELVPGDVVILEAGDQVPADGRVCSAIRLVANEASLTGESFAVVKDNEPSPADVAIADQASMLFSGTTVVAGRGHLVVTGTGSTTEMGQIAALFSGAQPTTPLQQDLAKVGRRLGLVAVGAAAVIFGAGVIRSFPVETMALTAVALAVAAIPEGLPAVVTVSLAGGLQRMARRNAIVRRLPAVETLGAVNIICTDKTGTLTTNELKVGEIVLADGRHSDVPFHEDDAWKAFVAAAALCNDAYRSSEGLSGDPTEIALLRSLERGGIDFEATRDAMPRLDESAFDGRRKRMSTLHADQGGFVLYTKGAPEVVVARSSSVLGATGKAPLDDPARDQQLEIAENLAGRGMRTLALAVKWLPRRPEDPADEEHDLCLIGLVGLNERVRREVPSAIEVAERAGVTTVMVTGDHATTARAVAEMVGLEDGDLMEGRRLAEMSTEELAPRIGRYRVFARVDPADKVKIIDAWKRSGATVAMTGDGVNDAPALHRADIGVAMGTGTDVARESSAMVLADDNYATIVTAISEGRRIFNNLRNVVHYLLSANASEVIYVLTGFLVFGYLGEPLLAVQLLWINLMSDALPAIALGMDLPTRDLMKDRPGRGRDVLSRRNAGLLLTQGTILAAAALLAMLAGAYLLDLGNADVRTMVFSTLVFSQLLHALSVRAGSGPLRRPGKFMFWSLLGAAVLQFLVIYLPIGNQILRTAPLSAWALACAIGASGLSMILVRRVNRSFGETDR